MGKLVALVTADGARISAWRADPAARKWLYIAAAAVGVGLWIHQYILYYVVAISVAIAMDNRHVLRDVTLPLWLRALITLAAVVAAIYIALGLAAFFTSGVDVHVRGVRITATHPQKMWWIAGTAAAVALALVIAATFRSRVIAPAMAFLAGYSPAILGRIANHDPGAPISRLDFAGLRHALPDITGVMLPMLLGFRDPSAARTVYGPLVLVLAVAGAWSCWTVWRRRGCPVFHLLPIVGAVLFFVSGSYIDAQSYRYLMPMYAALPAIYAVGIDAAWNTARVAGAALLLLVLAVFAAQQLAWYSHLQPDAITAKTIACLDAAGIRAARAPYWQSYTITFLTDERIIVSPTDGVDRYPKDSEIMTSGPTVESVCR